MKKTKKNKKKDKKYWVCVNFCGEFIHSASPRLKGRFWCDPFIIATSKTFDTMTTNFTSNIILSFYMWYVHDITSDQKRSHKASVKPHTNEISMKICAFLSPEKGVRNMCKVMWSMCYEHHIYVLGPFANRAVRRQ